MKTNFSLLFYLKRPKDYTTGVAPIYLRITVNGKRSELATGKDVSRNNGILKPDTFGVRKKIRKLLMPIWIK